MIAAAPMTHVPKAGVPYSGWTSLNLSGNAPETAIESEPREAGRIVVCVEASPEMMIERMRTQSSGPSTISPTSPKSASSSSYSPRVSRLSIPRTATADPR